MPWPREVLVKLKRLETSREILRNTLTGREEAVDALVLATLAQEHVLLVGPPGTAKSDLVVRFAAAFKARCFRYLLTRFSEPPELFGPMDIEKFKHGTYHVRTEGMLPSAEIAFLDEVFHGSSAILNALLTLVQERVFHNGAVVERTPLMTLVGATNDLPDDTTLKAFSDRFLVRVRVDPVDDDALEALLERGWALEQKRIQRVADMADAPLTSVELGELHARLAEVDLKPVRGLLAELIRRLRAEGVELSDRRIVKTQKLVGAAALMDRVTEASAIHLSPLRHIWTRSEEAKAVTDVVDRLLLDEGATSVKPRSDLAELKGQLAPLAAKADKMRSESEITVWLTRLNRVRHTVLDDHPHEEGLLTEIDAVIHRLLEALGRV